MRFHFAAITNSEVEKAKKNSDFKVELFYRDVLPIINSLLLKYEISYNDREDFIQELYISYEKALNAFKAKKEGARFTTFLYKVLSNDLKTLINKYQKELAKRYELRETPNKSVQEMLESIPFSGLNPEQQAIYQEYVKRLEDLLQSLSPEERDIIMYLREGYSISEIAKKMGVTPQHIIAQTKSPDGPLYRKVKKILAKREIRRKIAQEPEEPGGLGEFPGPTDEMGGGFPERTPEVPKETETDKARKLVLEDVKKIKALENPKSKKDYLEELKKKGWTEERLVELFGDDFLDLFKD